MEGGRGHCTSTCLCRFGSGTGVVLVRLGPIEYSWTRSGIFWYVLVRYVLVRYVLVRYDSI